MLIMGLNMHMPMQIDERRQRLIRSFCAKGPVYENCRMLSHNGTPLSFIDYRKLAWYEVRARTLQ